MKIEGGVMSRLLLIGAGGVARVAAYKCVQNSDIFQEMCIASRTLRKCEELKVELDGKGTEITTAQVDADDVEQLIKLINSYQPDLIFAFGFTLSKLSYNGCLFSNRNGLY